MQAVIRWLTVLLPRITARPLAVFIAQQVFSVLPGGVEPPTRGLETAAFGKALRPTWTP